MAQLNPNFEIDFSDINSYEQIQLINDTQLAKENLLMHRAYKEPSDDEIIRNHFSSFTFVDFCPKLFSVKQQTSPASPSPTFNDAKVAANPIHRPASRALRHYELETFSDLFERINNWLKLNKDWRVVSMETLKFDCTSQFNHVKSSILSKFLPQNTRGLRLFLSPSKSRFSGSQKIGCINVVPRKLSGSHTDPKDPPVYENLDQILHRLNELLLMRPIEGRILSVETITLPMVNGYVDTESNYFMDVRLNLLNECTYNLAAYETNDATKLHATRNNLDSNRDVFTSRPQLMEATLRSHSLIDILRVYYEFGPMVCGLVNLIDFVPRFYSPTPTLAEAQNSSLPDGQLDGSQPASDQAGGGGAGEKIAATESLTRLIRRSLAWFEAEKERVLSASGQPEADVQGDQSAAKGCEINLKLCNLQVHHKTLLKSHLIRVKPNNAIQTLDTRSMIHERISTLEPIVCAQCNTTSATSSVQDWCSHLLDLSQPQQVKFVRLAYVVPVYNKFARSMNQMRPFRAQRHRHRTRPAKAKVLHAASEGDVDLEESVQPVSSTADVLNALESSTDSSASPVASFSSSTSSASTASSKNSASELPLFVTGQPLDAPAKKPAANSGDQLHDSSLGATDLDTKLIDELLVENKEDERSKRAALDAVKQTNARHKRDEEAHQNKETDDGLNDSPIGHLTYRLFAPCQLVNSSSCFSINPVNSSSPLARRGSVDLEGSGMSSENAHPSTSLLGSASYLSQVSDVQQAVISFGAFFPALSHDIMGSANVASSPGSPGPSYSKSQQSSGGRFTTNEFEPVDAIRRRMEVYVTTNSMKVIAGETLIVSLNDVLSCLSTAIEQTVVKSVASQRRQTTWVSVYVLYAAVDEPQLPKQLLAEQKLRELKMIEEERGKSDLFNDEFNSLPGDRSQQVASEPDGDTIGGQLKPRIRIEQNPVDSSLTLYNSAYDRTVALPTPPENHITSMEPIEFLGLNSDCLLWLNENDLIEAQQWKQHSDTDLKSRKSRRKRKLKGRHREDSQCSIM